MSDDILNEISIILNDVYVYGIFSVSLFYSKNRWHRARTNLVQSIIKLGGRCSRESMALMSKGVIAFEKSPEKEQVSCKMHGKVIADSILFFPQINETIAEMRKLLKQLYSYVKVILKGDMTEEVKSALQTIFVNIRMTWGIKFSLKSHQIGINVQQRWCRIRIRVPNQCMNKLLGPIRNVCICLMPCIDF